MRKLTRVEQETLRKHEAIVHMMERRFQVGDRQLLARTILWRMRRYCDDGEPEKADVLAELLPEELVVPFYEFYYGSDPPGHGPLRMSRHDQ